MRARSDLIRHFLMTVWLLACSGGDAALEAGGSGEPAGPPAPAPGSEATAPPAAAPERDAAEIPVDVPQTHPDEEALRKLDERVRAAASLDAAGVRATPSRSVAH